MKATAIDKIEYIELCMTAMKKVRENVIKHNYKIVETDIKNRGFKKA